MRYSSTSRLKLQYQIAYTKKDTETSRALMKVSILHQRGKQAHQRLAQPLHERGVLQTDMLAVIHAE